MGMISFALSVLALYVFVSVGLCLLFKNSTHSDDDDYNNKNSTTTTRTTKAKYNRTAT